METDVGTVEPSRIDFQGLRNDSFPQELNEIEPMTETVPDNTVNQPQQENMQQWDPTQYYPPSHVYQQKDKKDVFADMDRSTYIFISIAFVIGFFIGRGMIQPVILKGH
tara:strand:+ start:450 stop:776 length:327 start_codon:yes stop_codon:yes gene_type:complete